jgi:outer membrane lipoprotein carrier protein
VKTATRTTLAVLLFAWLGADGASAGGSAEEPKSGTGCAVGVAERVQAHYDGVQDLVARFEQTTESVSLGSTAAASLAARGTVTFAKPGKMRWSYEAPEESLVVSDGKTLWLYEPAAGEAQRFEVTEGFLSGAPIQFLLGSGRVLRAFDVASPDCPASGTGAGGAPVRLELRPREPATYELLVLMVDPDTGAVSETLVQDLLGNRTRVRLEDVRANQGVAPELFEFEPPEGVRILDVSP